MSKQNRDLFIWIGLVVLVIAAIIYGWMAFFVLLLEYDYITSSSILFTVFLAYILVVNAGSIFRVVKDREIGGAIGILIAVLLLMASLTGGLGVFTSLHKPDISDRFDMVGSFWSTIGLPFVLLVKALGDMLVAILIFLAKGIPLLRDGLTAVLTFVEQSPTFSNAFGGLLSATLTALLFRTRIFPVSAPAA